MDTLFFTASKLIWVLVRPETLIALLLVTGWLLLRIGWARVGQSISMVSILSVCVIAVFPVGDAFLSHLEKTYPTEPKVRKVVGIVVLGGGENDIQSSAWSQPNTGDAGDRFIIALALAHKHPEATVLFTGGSGRLISGATGAEIARDIFLEAGLDKNRLIVDFHPELRRLGG